jgi:hypothetical protein
MGRVPLDRLTGIVVQGILSVRGISLPVRAVSFNRAYNPAMYQLRLAILSLMLLSRVVAEDPAIQRRREETISNADGMFGERYTPVAGKPMRLYDKQTQTGPADAIIYWHGSSYVIWLIFAADGTVARIMLLPEALLHSDSWTDVPNGVELSPAEMQWLIVSANALRPLGKVREISDVPNGCFQSGKNLYCADQYELAAVPHYHIERLSAQGTPETTLEDIAISYKQSVVGIVENIKTEGSRRHLKVAGQWYHGEKPGVEIFDKAEIGSLVRLVTYGCTANERACIAVPEKSESTSTNQ